MSGPSISVVVAGRNDDYGGDFRDRLLRTAAHNTTLLTRAGLTFEYLLVEWNPVPDRDLLAHEFVSNVPGARVIVAPSAVHDAYSLQNTMPFHEMPAKNVGIRRARAPWLIVTNADVLFGPAIVERLTAGALDPRKLYRARRIDVAPSCTWEEMQDPTRHLRSGEGATVPVDYLGAGGDFCLASRALWHELRGFDERIRFSTRAKDWQFFLSAQQRGIGVEFIGEVFHLDHSEGFQNTADSVRRSSTAHFGGPWDIEFGLPTLNADDWGLGGLDCVAATDGQVETLCGVPQFSVDRQFIGEALRDWLAGSEPDWITAGFALALLRAWQSGRRLWVRLETPRVAARLQGFLALARQLEIEVVGDWHWPTHEGFTLDDLMAGPSDGPRSEDWILTEYEGRLTMMRDGRSVSFWPSRRPPQQPRFNPVLARRVLRAWIELEKAGARRVFLFGAGSHTRELLAFGWPDSQRLLGIVTTNQIGGTLKGLPIRHLAGLAPDAADAIVVSSVTYELEMVAAARAAGFHHVVSLYDAWPRTWTGGTEAPVPVEGATP
jgi:hypothetical protein